MPTPVSDAIQEAQVTGRLIRGVGPIITLSLAVLVLGAALAFSMVNERVGADRWTGTDQQQYASEHAVVHKEEDKEDKQVGAEVTAIHEDVAVLKSTVNRMERDLQIIKSAVINIERNGNH